MEVQRKKRTIIGRRKRRRYNVMEGQWRNMRKRETEGKKKDYWKRKKRKGKRT